MIHQQLLSNLYVQQKLSMAQIAKKLNVSVHQVEYWLKKHDIKRRNRSEAGYIRKNPDGDPFVVKRLTSFEDAYLYGLGMGLYWGEGTKANTHSVRLGNSDPELIRAFYKVSD